MIIVIIIILINHNNSNYYDYYYYKATYTTGHRCICFNVINSVLSGDVMFLLLFSAHICFVLDCSARG